MNFFVITERFRAAPALRKYNNSTMINELYFSNMVGSIRIPVPEM